MKEALAELDMAPEDFAVLCLRGARRSQDPTGMQKFVDIIEYKGSEQRKAALNKVLSNHLRALGMSAIFSQSSGAKYPFEVPPSTMDGVWAQTGESPKLDDGWHFEYFGDSLLKVAEGCTSALCSIQVESIVRVVRD